MATQAQAERRRKDRVSSRMTVGYRLDGQAVWDVSSFRDVSPTGARLVCDAGIQPGETIQLRLGLPMFDEPIHMAAELMWRRMVFSGRLQMADCGVRFHGVTSAMRERLEIAIQRLEAKQERARV